MNFRILCFSVCFDDEMSAYRMDDTARGIKSNIELANGKKQQKMVDSQCIITKSSTEQLKINSSVKIKSKKTNKIKVEQQVAK